jgi:hypothetical protein
VTSAVVVIGIDGIVRRTGEDLELSVQHHPRRISTWGFSFANRKPMRVRSVAAVPVGV